MSPNKLASELLKYSSTTSLMLPGLLTAAIGNEGVQEALNRNWVRPDTETGFLCLTDHQGHINDMRELAATEEVPVPAPGPAVESASHRYVMSHANRLHEAFGLGPTDGSSGAFGTGQPAAGNVTAPVNQTPTSASPAKPGQDYMVGEDVMVADEGKSYQAKVKSANPDGTYSLSFGPNRPPTQDRMFRKEEMQKIQPEREGTVKVQQ